MTPIPNDLRARVISAYSYHSGQSAAEAARQLMAHAVARGIRQPRRPPPGNALTAWTRSEAKAPQWAVQAAADWLVQHRGTTPGEAEAAAAVLALCPIDDQA